MAGFLPKHGLVTSDSEDGTGGGKGGGGWKMLVKENKWKKRASENFAILMLKHYVW